MYVRDDDDGKPVYNIGENICCLVVNGYNKELLSMTVCVDRWLVVYLANDNEEEVDRCALFFVLIRYFF